MLSIVVLQRGWVVVGIVRREGPMGQRLVVERSRVVRRWGTEHGLPELANKGPRPNTILDDEAKHPLRVHELAVVLELGCEANAWREVYA